MIRKIIAVVLQILRIFCLVYSTIVRESIIPYYIFFPLYILFLECFEKINLKKTIKVVVFIFFLTEMVYALFWYWKKADYISPVFPLVCTLMCLVPNVIKWVLKKKKDGFSLWEFSKREEK